MKGSAITGPVGKEAADLWPVSAQILYPFLSNPRTVSNTLAASIAYRLQLRCSYVESTNLKLAILQKINKRLSGFSFSIVCSFRYTQSGLGALRQCVGGYIWNTGVSKKSLVLGAYSYPGSE